MNNNDELNGTFNYLPPADKIMFSTAYRAITQLELWDYVKNIDNHNHNDRFCYNSEETKKIYNKIEELGYDGHSGYSYICTLKEMQFIAKYGEKEFKTRYDTYEKKTSTDKKIQERRRLIASLL